MVTTSCFDDNMMMGLDLNIFPYVLEGDIQQKGKTKASVLLIAKCAQNIFSVGHFSGQRMQTAIQVFVKVILKCKPDMESLVSLVYTGS